MKRAAISVLLVALVALLAGCGEDDSGDGGDAAAFAAEASHIHGLGINPADGSLFIATHGGLFRAADDSSAPAPAGDVGYDLMGFTVAGHDRFLASGHPGPGEGSSPHLGLVESRDAGQTWTAVSLGGRADFHVLRAAGETIYGYDGLDGRLMVSTDGGASWQAKSPPTPLFDLAIDPRDPDRFVAASEAGLYEGGRAGSWTQISESVGLLAWAKGGPLILVEGDGTVSAREDDGGTWRTVGSLPEVPVALNAASAQELYAALPDGTVLQSLDGGGSWSPRVQP